MVLDANGTPYAYAQGGQAPPRAPAGYDPNNPYAGYNPQSYSGKGDYSWGEVGRDAATGAAIGGTIGSAFTPVGTAVGAVIGGVVGGGYGVVKKFTGGHGGKARAQNFAYQQMVAGNKRNYDYENYNQQLGQYQSWEDEQRKNAISALDKSFASPQREASREAMYNADLGTERENLNYGYKNSVRDASLEAARRGRLGSSVDAEKQSALRGTLVNGLTEAENSANARRSTATELDSRQLQQLRRALLAGDPQSEQEYRGQAQQSQGELDRLIASGQRDQRDRERAAQERYDRNAMWGSLANAGATGVYSYHGNPQYGGG